MTANPDKAISNADIAAVFDEIADLLELSNDNQFRIRAYRNAARSLRTLSTELAPLIRKGQDLPKLPGIGEDLSGKIREIVGTGACALRDRLSGQIPHALLDLLAIPGLGPKRVQHLYHELGIETPQQLYDAAKDGRLSTLHGFGARTQENLLRAIETRRRAGGRVLLAQAAPVGEAIVAFLRGAKSAVEAEVAGSLRRMQDTVGDVDIVASAGDRAALMRRFLSYPEIGQVLAAGETRASVVLRSGLQVDLRVVGSEAFGATLVYFTGSKSHSIAIRRRAQDLGLKLNEYGVFKGRRRIAGETEAAVYRALRLPDIPPELRENRGELEAAERGSLPKLIETSDLKGDLHAHTRASDGVSTIEDLALAAHTAGLEYLAITDHSHHLRVAHGLDTDAVLKQAEKIDRLNEKLKGIRLLKGIEVDILEDGTLDLPDDVLARLDVVIGAVHSHFALPRIAQMRRLQRAMSHRYFTVLAHPLTRLIGKREALDIDMSALIRAARERGCALELNAQPRRMDLTDVYCREAKDQGVKICINSDAHAPGDFGNLHYGVGQARRGWLEKTDVLNARSLLELRKFLKKGRG